MKHSTLFLSALVIAVFVGGTSALMQQNYNKQLQDKGIDSAPPVLEAIPQTYMNQTSRHKLILAVADAQVYADLQNQNAIVDEINYGSFKVVTIDEQAVGGRAALQALATPVHDEQNFIALNGFVLDTTNPEVTYAQLPADLHKPDMADALTRDLRPRGGLYLVQFAGPVKDDWLAALKNSGAEIVSYMPSNAYVVRSKAKAATALKAFKQNRFVQFVGDYEPAYRLSPELRSLRSVDGTAFVDITVQVIEGANAKKTLANLAALASAGIQTHQVLNYHNVEMRVQASRLAEIAFYDDVFAVEPQRQRRRLDEAQGQIVAGNLTGNSPTGPGYLTWLAGKGFTSSQFTTFAVNVVDDALTLTGHPDLPTARVAFTNNPTAQTGMQGGHGFLNANIIAGFNSGTGAAVEDANGFNYGLGISPFARVGSTAIFGATASSSTAWESTAYGQGARLSSNSWGFQTQTGGPVAVYDASAQEYDRIVRDAQTTAGLQQLSIVFAAGNDGSGANTVSSPATAKNIICVGASENVRQTGTDGCAVANTGADSANDIIGFSSRGPVNSAGGDGRIKPDIMAPGTHIEAGVPQSNYDGTSVCDKFFPTGQTLYGWSSGTSHSCPAVAGGASLVYQNFLNNSLAAPSPAMVKAYLMNSASYMSGVGANDTLPSNNQGMGRMDLGRAFDGSARILVDQTQVLGTTGQTFQVTGSVVSSAQPFRVTLAWTDAAGPTTGAPWVNNLDLEVTINGTTFKGNVFSGANSVAGGTADGKNNVESVFLPAGTTGSFTVTVRATNIAGDGVPGNADTTDQDFALVVYNANTGTPTSPTIGVSPASFSFTATAGGANPASQSLSITNTGGGTLSWTASSNQTWLSVSPTSGTAPSTATVSANITGLAAGTYNGAITISATGATNTPVTVPVTLTVNAAGGCTGQLIVNGGFEGSASPWTLSGAVFSTGSFPHSGTGYTILGGGNNNSHTEFQQITIPAGCSKNLTLWLNVTSSETTTTTQFDKIFIEVRSTSGTLLATLATFSNLNKGTAGVYVQRGPFSLASFAGQTVRIQFRATTDGSLISTFRVDDVSVQ
ncbi:MAG: S8 family serine peptidase [Acidobacteria bacterium]|nr:S8 family serine peptidase [Acidobacteriota bacterium]